MRNLRLEIKVGKSNVVATCSYSGLTKETIETINGDFAKAVLKHIKGDKK